MEQVKVELAETIADLDSKLNKVVSRQELDFLAGYSLFVSKKSRELRDIIDKLNEKNQGNSIKDDKIEELELLIHKLRSEA